MTHGSGLKTSCRGRRDMFNLPKDRLCFCSFDASRLCYFMKFKLNYFKYSSFPAYIHDLFLNIYIQIDIYYNKYS